MNASFEEKSVWIQLISMALALGGYFVVAGLMFSSGIDVLSAYVPLFIASVVVMVIVLVFGHTLAAITGRPEQRDERDRLIGWRAESNSGWVLAAGVLTAITCMILSINSVWVAHLLLLSLFASHVVCYVFQILYYRRGI